MNPVPPDLSQPPEEESGIFFYSEDIDFELQSEETIRSWISKIVAIEKKNLHLINFVFCSDPYLHQLNIEYLSHDTLTDIITFPYRSLPNIEGDIFISIDRIRENAQSYSVSFFQELCRVMAHGTLHLCGYGDKSAAEKQLMTQKENESLDLLQL